MLQITVTLIFDLLILKSIKIIDGSWPTKTLIMVSQSLIGFKLLSRQGFYVQDHCDHDLWTTDTKIIGIIYGSWPFMIQRKVNLDETIAECDSYPHRCPWQSRYKGKKGSGGWLSPPPFGTQYSVFLDGTQYAKGRYAVHRNSVISYADINFYFKKVQFSSRNTTKDQNRAVRSTQGGGGCHPCSAHCPVGVNIWFKFEENPFISIEFIERTWHFV